MESGDGQEKRQKDVYVCGVPCICERGRDKKVRKQINVKMRINKFPRMYRDEMKKHKGTEIIEQMISKTKISLL